MAAPSFQADDLAKLHSDFADPELRLDDGTAITGFIEEQRELEQDDYAPGVTGRTTLILRSPERYALDTVIVRGADRWQVAAVDGEERGWRHALSHA